MRLTIVLGLPLGLYGASRPAAAQGPAAPPAACAPAVVRDTASATWKGIDAQYARLADAMRRKDVDALFALYTPDYRVVMPGGEVWTRERSLAYQRDGLAQVRETQHISNTVLRLTACGARATATVLQMWHRTQTMAGQPRQVETTAVQDEEWVRTPDGWRRGNIVEVRNGPAFVDGKAVDTRRPYDPEAPAYDPHDPRPRRPVTDTLLPLITERGAVAAVESYRTLRQSPAYYVTEGQLNTLGYRLLGLKRVPDAVAVFELNVAEHPRSGNAYDSLGEAYLAGGDRGAALRSYQRALELNPQNANAAEQIRKLQSR